jgi:hypothetical protein
MSDRRGVRAYDRLPIADVGDSASRSAFDLNGFEHNIERRFGSFAFSFVEVVI